MAAKFLAPVREQARDVASVRGAHVPACAVTTRKQNKAREESGQSAVANEDGRALGTGHGEAAGSRQ